MTHNSTVNSPDTSKHNKSLIINIEEIEHLVRYIARKGIDTDGKLTSESAEAIRSYKNDKSDQNAIALLGLYAKLNAKTYPEHGVSGDTALDSTSFMVHRIPGLIFWSMLFVSLAIMTEIFSRYYAIEPSNFDLQSGSGINLNLLSEDSFHLIHAYGLSYMLPFFWGGTGACVYLLKTLSDLSADYKFSTQKYQGGFSRIFLGALFGGVVVNLFYDTAEMQSAIEGLNAASLAPSAVAFISGLGVRAIYGAFEKLVDTVHDRIQSIGRDAKNNPHASKENTKLSQIDREDRA